MSIVQVVADVSFLICFFVCGFFIFFLVGKVVCGWLNCAEQCLSPFWAQGWAMKSEKEMMMGDYHKNTGIHNLSAKARGRCISYQGNSNTDKLVYFLLDAQRPHQDFWRRNQIMVGAPNGPGR